MTNGAGRLPRGIFDELTLLAVVLVLGKRDMGSGCVGTIPLPYIGLFGFE